MPLIVGLIIGLVVLVGAVLLVVAGIRVARNQDQFDPLMARLEEATQRGDVVTSLEQIEMQQPFMQRVIVPMLQRIGAAYGVTLALPGEPEANRPKGEMLRRQLRITEIPGLDVTSFQPQGAGTK